MCVSVAWRGVAWHGKTGVRTGFFASFLCLLVGFCCFLFFRFRCAHYRSRYTVSNLGRSRPAAFLIPLVSLSFCLFLIPFLQELWRRLPALSELPVTHIPGNAEDERYPALGWQAFAAQRMVQR